MHVGSLLGVWVWPLPPGRPAPAAHDGPPALGLLPPEALGHAMDVAVTFLGNAGPVAPDLLYHRINLHDQSPGYSNGSSISSSGEQITGEARCSRLLSASIGVRLLALARFST